jgi:N-glycosylase/DNA lyase
MKKLLDSLENLKNSSVKKLVDSRIREFQRLGESSRDEIFQELCFCLLTANYSAEGGIRIQRELGKGFSDLPEDKLARRLKGLGHRYPDARAGYIAEARKIRDSLLDLKSRSGKQAREWLVKNVRGLGWKEASHFLRNIGFEDLAIIDFHILDLLVGEGLIKRPKNLTKRRYLEIESVLEGIAEKAGLTLAELDLYLWYLETGKVLK